MIQYWCAILLRTRAFLAFCFLMLTACEQDKGDLQVSTSDNISAESVIIALPVIPEGMKADKILVDKSDRHLILFAGEEEIARYENVRFGDTPDGHKQFEGDERTPEGEYIIEGRNPGSSYHLSLRISYPNASDIAFAEQHGKSAGGDIFIHGQPNGYDGAAISRDWTDGCIALSNAEIKQIWDVVPDGTKIIIQP